MLLSLLSPNGFTFWVSIAAVSLSANFDLFALKDNEKNITECGLLIDTLPSGKEDILDVLSTDGIFDDLLTEGRTTPKICPDGRGGWNCAPSWRGLGRSFQ